MSRPKSLFNMVSSTLSVAKRAWQGPNPLKQNKKDLLVDCTCIVTTFSLAGCCSKQMSSDSYGIQSFSNF